MLIPRGLYRQGINNRSRREFIGSAFLALASVSPAQHLLAASLCCKAAKVTVGAHPWVYAAKQPGFDITPILSEIFADMQYAGMDGIELMHTTLEPKDAVERISKLSRKYQLPVIGASFSGNMWDRTKHSAILENAELVITRLAKLGGRTLGVSVGSAAAKKTAQQFDDQAEVLRKIIAIGNNNGVVLNLHNHIYEVANNQYDLKGTLSRIPDIKLGPDLNWLVRAGIDPASFIREYGKQIVFLHLRDQKADGRWSEALGEGVTDFNKISQALRDIKFQGDVVIELAHEKSFKQTRPLRESLKISREYVQQILG